MKKTAIILGASGLTGSLVLEKLLADNRYDTIKLFSRTKSYFSHPKVIEKLGNLLEFRNFKTDFTGDEVYCCIGTTTKKTPDKVLYKNIDFGIPVNAAKLAKKNNVDTFLVVSAMGANEHSSIFYNKTKGEMENTVFSQNIPNTYILRPSFIGGDRRESRIFEKIGLVVFKIIQPLFFGKFRKYRIIEAKSIAEAMIELANTKPKNKHIILSDAIQEIADGIAK